MKHLAATITFLLLASPVIAASPVIPEPEVTLINPGGGPFLDGRYVLGLDLVLPDGWHSYWRNPGDAGLPPDFDATKSENLKQISINFPAPERYFDGFNASIVYHDKVTFPLRLIPEDPSLPIRLALTFNYGYCKDICVPGSASFRVDLAPDDAIDETIMQKIWAALEKVPTTESGASDEAPKLTTLAAGATLDATVTIADPAEKVELFVEGPEGWYFSPPEPPPTGSSTRVFHIGLDGLPKDASLNGTSLNFTIVGEKAAVEIDRAIE